MDQNRTFAYNYLIETGGEKVYTVIYTQKAAPGPFSGDLTLLEQIAIKPRKWHSIDVTRVHAVCNIHQNAIRVSVSVTYLDDRERSMKKAADREQSLLGKATKEKSENLCNIF